MDAGKKERADLCRPDTKYWRRGLRGTPRALVLQLREQLHGMAVPRQSVYMQP